MKTAELKTLPVSVLKPAEYNPRKKLKPGDKEYERIKHSIQEFGFADPLVVNRDMTIIGGHQRLTVAMELGFTEVPCAVVDIDKTREKALNIALNKITGEWDENLLSDLLSQIADAADFDITYTGFDLPDIEQLFNKVHDKTVKEDDFDVDAELEKPTFSKLGDIWCLGNHKVICGDSTKPETYEKLLEGTKVNLVLSDLPYFVDYHGSAGTIQNDNLADDEALEFTEKAMKCMYDSLADDGSIYIFHSDSKGLIFRKAFHDAGFYLSGCCIWKKDSLVLGRSPYQWQHEPCQPAGTMVWTPEGKKPIENLKDGDLVVSFDTHSGTVKGYRDGFAVKTASRHYNGKLYGIRVGDRQTWATDNHRFSVHFNPAMSETWCTYLMSNEKGWWRVGISRTYDARGFGLKHRVNQEHANRAWLISTFKNQAEAQMGEQFLAATYGIPYTHWEVERGCNDDCNHRSEENIEWLYGKMDLEEMRKNAIRLLEDHDRSIDYPLVTEDTGKDKFSRRVTVKINACNLIPGLMMVPIPYESYQGDETFEYNAIDAVDVKPYDGEVYSLAVDKYEHYIADGIVTHNCLYGWKKDGKHQWYSDRKQTTIWEYDKPKSSKLHPTMKPVGLMAYPIKNSTMTNGIVLDPFLGSGSTMIACDETERVCRGIELDPKYVDVIVRRYVETKSGNTEGVYLIRDGQRLTLEEAVQLIEGNAADNTEAESNEGN